MSVKKKSKRHAVYDGTDAILGRFASHLAKMLLLGEKIAVINAEKIVISGSKKNILEKYKIWLQIRTHTAPWKGPLHPRRPDLLFKRTVRGMLPKKKDRGANALKKLKVYIGVPDHFKDAEKIMINDYHVSRLDRSYHTLGEVSKELGWNGYIS